MGKASRSSRERRTNMEQKAAEGSSNAAQHGGVKPSNSSTPHTLPPALPEPLSEPAEAENMEHTSACGSAEPANETLPANVEKVPAAVRAAREMLGPSVWTLAHQFLQLCAANGCPLDEQRRYGTGQHAGNRRPNVSTTCHPECHTYALC